MQPRLDMTAFKALLAKVANAQSLTEEEAEQAFSIIMAGDATPAQMGGFLMALRVRGETVAEITGAARVMRAKALALKAPPDVIDTCGTGGDARGTYNISTATAFVVAGCGVKVAKHGNRAVSSRSGAADVLAALGVNLDADLPLVERALHEAGIAFLMAPRHHMAMRNVAATRSEMGARTIFNLMGPLANPAGAKRQLLGVFARHWVEPIARVLANLGSERAWVVHGEDGLDEMTVSGSTYVAELRDGKIRSFSIAPEEAGLPRWKLGELLGGDAQTNADALRYVLAGGHGAYRDVVLLNAAASLVIAERVEDLRQGVAMAAHSLDSGRAQTALDALITITNTQMA
jgi:anthranilate phosphoribosyltransferase